MFEFQKLSFMFVQFDINKIFKISIFEICQNMYQKDQFELLCIRSNLISIFNSIVYPTLQSLKLCKWKRKNTHQSKSNFFFRKCRIYIPAVDDSTKFIEITKKAFIVLYIVLLQVHISNFQLKCSFLHKIFFFGNFNF